MDEPPQPRRSSLSPFAWFGKYLSLALTLPASVAAGYIVGVVVNHWWPSPLARAAGILLGMAAGITQVIREVSRDHKRS